MALSPFSEERLPEDIERGASGGPSFNTSIFEQKNGGEQRNQNWHRARYSYDVSYGIRTKEEYVQLIDFYKRRQGRYEGFRFKDWLDFSIEGRLINFLGVADGVRTEFQIYKAYANGYWRPILKPVENTVFIHDSTDTDIPSKEEIEDPNNPGSKIEITNWEVNLDTGIITFTEAPDYDTVLYVNCEFDIPVRFMDDNLQFNIIYIEAGSIPNIQLLELKPLNIPASPPSMLLEPEPSTILVGFGIYRSQISLLQRMNTETGMTEYYFGVKRNEDKNDNIEYSVSPGNLNNMHTHEYIEQAYREGSIIPAEDPRLPTGENTSNSIPFGFRVHVEFMGEVFSGFASYRDWRSEERYPDLPIRIERAVVYNSYRIDKIFPEELPRNIIGGPVYSTDIASSTTGYELRVINTELEKLRLSMSYGVFTIGYYRRLLDLFYACRGRLETFTFTDTITKVIDSEFARNNPMSPDAMYDRLVMRFESDTLSMSIREIEKAEVPSVDIIGTLDLAGGPPGGPPPPSGRLPNPIRGPISNPIRRSLPDGECALRNLPFLVFSTGIATSSYIPLGPCEGEWVLETTLGGLGIINTYNENLPNYPPPDHLIIAVVTGFTVGLALGNIYVYKRTTVS